MRKVSLAVVTSVVLAVGPVTAQEVSERYRMVPTSDGFLEIERRTGVVRECKRGGDGYRCTAASQDNLQAALDRLARENAELKQRLPPTPGAPVQTSPIPLPSDEEIDRALGAMEKFLRRFMNIMREERP